MKKLAKWLICLTLLILSVGIFAANPHEKAQEALEKYLELTDIEDILMVKDSDSPCEVQLPANVTAGLKEKEIYEALYRKVGIDLKEELARGNLYLEDDTYYINFKEKNIKKKIINDLRKDFNINVKEVSLQNALKIWGINLKKQNLKTIDDLKFLISLQLVYLYKNPDIKDYFATKYWKNLKSLSLRNNKILCLSFLKNINTKVNLLDLQNNQIDNISIISRFTDLSSLLLSNNNIKSLKGIENNKKEISDLYVNGNPITIEGLSYIEKLCREEKVYRLYIDRKVFKEYQYFSEYPEYLQWVNYIYFVENNGKITEHYAEY